MQDKQGRGKPAALCKVRTNRRVVDDLTIPFAPNRIVFLHNIFRARARKKKITLFKINNQDENVEQFNRSKRFNFYKSHKFRMRR